MKTTAILHGFIFSNLALFAASLAAWLLNDFHHANLALVFLLAVLVVGLRYGYAHALYASILGFGVYVYVFTRPYFTFSAGQDEDVDTLIFFLITAAVAGNMAARLRRYMIWKKNAAERMSAMYEFSEKLSAASSLESVYHALLESVHSVLKVPVEVRFTDNGKTLVYPQGGDDQLSAGVTPADPQCRFRITIAGGCFAELLPHSAAINHAQRELIDNFCRQAAITTERIRLVDDLEKKKLNLETEKLRSALLSSVSHDLKTPLASIIGAISSIIEYGQQLSEKDQAELQQSILTEAQRLNRYIQNLLDMTRLEGGKLTLSRDWVDIRDIIASASSRLKTLLVDKELVTDIADDITLICVHGVFIEQCLVNILENACRFTDPGGCIRVHAYRREEWLLIDITDEGPGIPEQARDKVFEMFYAIRQGDRKVGTAGLGLAISRGLARAHGGEVSIVDRPQEKGSCIRITLPLEPPENRSTLPGVSG